jgi:hypothetical protein
VSAWRALVLSLGVAAQAHATPYAQRLADDFVELQHALTKKCPARAAEIARLEPPSQRTAQTSPMQRAEALAHVGPCGTDNPLFLQTLGAAYLEAKDGVHAEAAFRQELALGVTEAGQAGLLGALAVQKSLTSSQRTDARKHLDYFRAHPCGRDDLCAGIAYAAMQLEDVPLARSSAEAAIALGFPGWQPYFFGGIAWATAPNPDDVKARHLLTEAKSRGAPAKYVDGFLDAIGRTAK